MTDLYVVEQAAGIIQRARSAQKPERRFCACGQELMGKLTSGVFCGECQLKRDFRWGAAWYDRFRPTQPPAQTEVIEHAWMTATSEGP